jgi:uncharacterized protein
MEHWRPRRSGSADDGANRTHRPQHPQTVALLIGPLVLFAITDAQPVLTREELLAARRSDQQTWQIKTASGPVKMLPFTAIDDEQYSTYLLVT